MSETIYRLAYCSRNALPADTDMEGELRRILDVARPNNARLGITGALLFSRGCFAQILEGPYAAVERVFEAIQHDERHRDVVALQFEAVGERGFGAWSMAYVGTMAEGDRRYEGIGVAADFNPANCTGAELFETLHRILLGQERSRSAA